MRSLIGICLLATIGFNSYAQVERPSAPNAKQVTAERAKAAKGDVTAMYNVGCYYYYGMGVPKNYTTASQWLTKAAAKDNTDAMLLLADIYDEGGTGIKKDPVKTLGWYKKAALKGSADAAYELGEMYESGDGVPANMAEAIKWYKIAAGKGDADAMIALGFCYMEGDGVPADHTAGYNWFIQAAEAGEVDAMRYLGDYYAQADMGNDCRKAIDWYMRAADAGDTMSIKPVGVTVMKDECSGVNKTAVAAWMRKMADKDMPDAAFYMGGFYIIGVGVAKDAGKGMEYLIRDRETGGYTGVRRNFSTNNLLTLYNSGDLNAEQKARLLEWFIKTAIKTNDDEMMSVIANIYVNMPNASGNDYRTGLDWAMRSAERGNPGGCFWVGFIYYKGLGDIKRNDVKAFTWIQKAAMKGDKDAMGMLATFYEFGTGTERNPAKAAEWKAKAEREE
ncbi:tetratricopeptide repeat protein [Nemorincola caseinilytica]|uniref:Tetratricopeptide repeat protein n=1 Tax=Nemorincola caseinilytica TaxID=2054315 RepID=A0ABP8N9M5_9BACT